MPHTRSPSPRLRRSTWCAPVQRTLDRSYFPRFNFQTSLFGRGTGALTNGVIDNSKGYYPDTANWATGLTITFSVSDIFEIRARRRIEEGNAAAEQARYDQTVNTLKAQEARARTLVESARHMAENTPVEVKAAEETLQRVEGEIRIRAGEHHRGCRCTTIAGAGRD